MRHTKSATLFFTEGFSDKVYQAQLKRNGEGYSVLFQYGRRGKPLTEGEKTQEPVPLAAAEKIFDKLVKSKIAKGYVADASGAVFSGAETAGRVTGFRPQLLNAVPLEHTRSWTPENADSHRGWYAQTKHDGERRGVILRDGGVIFANRKGLEVGVDARIADAFSTIARDMPGSAVLDGEDMGDHIAIFDVLEYPSMPPDARFQSRRLFLLSLEDMARASGVSGVVLVDVPEPATAFFARRGPEDLRLKGAEGYVLKHGDAVYTPGRPSAGGEALKIKFTESCTARVTKQNEGKRSVGLEMKDGDTWTPVGNVTIPGKGPVSISRGDLVEVEYLYAHEGGSLFQPVFKGLRRDVGEEACEMSTLKLKSKQPVLDPDVPAGEGAIESEAFDPTP